MNGRVDHVTLAIIDESDSMSDPKARMESLLTRSSVNSCEPRSPDPTCGNNNQCSVDIEGHWPVSPDVTLGDDGTSTEMELKLYESAIKDDENGFIDALEKISREKQLPPHEFFSSVSLMGNSLLHVAANNGNAKIVKLIIDYFPSLRDKRNDKGDTALHLAAKAGYKSAFNQLQNVFAGSQLPSTKYCHLVRREVALENLSLRIKNQGGNTPLHEGLIHCDPKVAEQLVQADWEVSYFLNNEGKSPLYLATEAGYVECLEQMLKDARIRNIFEKVKGKSPVHAAIMKEQKGIDALKLLLEKEPRFIHSTDEEGGTSLHCAASIGNLVGIKTLIGLCSRNALKRDKNGQLPIHLAAMKGHVDIIHELLKHYHDPHELLNSNGQNILHIAANSGKYNVVKYIIDTKNLKKLRKEKDKDGNTPLHLASMRWHPKIVSALTWDKTVDLKLINNNGLTALDAAEHYMEGIISFQQRLTWSALKAAGAMRASSDKILKARGKASQKKQQPDIDNYKDRVNTLLLVSTLVATVTFAAGFTMPGGYNNSDLDQGMATLIKHQMFYMFVFCDAIAMYSSLVVAVALIWAQLGDLGLVITALRLAVPILGIALTMMSLAFMAGVYLVVSKLHWLAFSVLVVGLIFLVAVVALFFPLCFPVTSRYRVLRCITFYLICLASFITGSS